jgi:hypothetical protein
MSKHLMNSVIRLVIGRRKKKKKPCNEPDLGEREKFLPICQLEREVMLRV